MGPEPIAEGPPSGGEILEAGPARLGVLDGWRALSISLVLASHWLPLGPHRFGLNYAAALGGMALFFTLSGFLIVSSLRGDPDVPAFVIRRLCRIVPLAYLASMVFLLLASTPLSHYPPYLLFYVNSLDPLLIPTTGPYWSLCVEVHFYALVATLVAALGPRGLLLIPALAAWLTAWKIRDHADGSILTHQRIDEILAGGCLALIRSDASGRAGRLVKRCLATVPVVVFAALFLVSCHAGSGSIRNFRAYLASALVGATLTRSDAFTDFLKTRPLRYVAEISFSLYLIHSLGNLGWLGTGGPWKYPIKRPIAFLITFALAHFSTFHFERRWIALGKRWTRRWRRRGLPGPASA